MGFFEKFGAALGFGETPKQAAEDVQTRMHDRVDRSKPFDEVEGPVHTSVTEEEWFGTTSDPRYSEYETYLESNRSLSEAPGTPREKRRFLEMKINIMRDALLSERGGENQNIKMLVDLERQWEKFADIATLQRSVDVIGEIVDLGQIIDTIAQTTQKLEKNKIVSFEDRLRAYLAKDTETRQFNDALDTAGYAVGSEAYRAWFQSTDKQRKLWEQFSKTEQEQLLNAGIHFQRGADMLRERLESLLTQNPKESAKRKVA